jgi:hypothetical protein
MRSLGRTIRSACVLPIVMVSLAGCSADESPSAGGAGGGLPSGGAGGTMAGAGGGGSGGGAPIGGASGVGGTSGSGGAAGDVAMGGVGGTAGTGTAGTPSLMCETTTVKEGTCKDKAEGVYAIKLEADVWWKDNGNGIAALPLVDAGRGKIIVHLMGHLTDVCDDGSNGIGEIRGCGTILPPIRSDVACDSFDITFPDAIWDSPDMPTFITTGEATGFNPADILTLHQKTGLLGFDMPDTEGAWPGYMETINVTCPGGVGVDCFPDHDGDGHPGITVVMGQIEQMDDRRLNGGTDVDMCGAGEPFVFRGVPPGGDPTALENEGVFFPKAYKNYIGLRVRMGGAGGIASDCMSGWGKSAADYMNSRVWGCELKDGTPCPDAHASFVDSISPVYHILKEGEAPPADVLQPPAPSYGNGMPLDQTPSRGALSALVRLGNLDQSFTCADVRNAAFPAFE